MTQRVKTPDFKMTLGTINFDDKEYHKRVQSIEVESLADSASSFTIYLDDGDDLFSSSRRVKEGDCAVIQLGYAADRIDKVLEGIITGVQSFRREYGRKLYKISGFDNLQALTRGRKRRSWETMKDSDVASEVVSESGLSIDADDTEFIHPYIAQNNVTNLEFLFERARRNGFEVRCEGKTVLFKKPQVQDSCCDLVWNASSPMARQGDSRILKRCNVASSTMGVVEEVVVRSYCPKKKKPIVASAKNVHGNTMGGDTTGPDFAKANNPGTTIQISDQPVMCEAEAEKLAWSILNQRAGNFMSGRCSSEGDGRIMSGRIVKIHEVGKEIDGDYYVTRSKHVMKVGNGPGFGYTTEFEVRRSGR